MFDYKRWCVYKREKGGEVLMEPTDLSTVEEWGIEYFEFISTFLEGHSYTVYKEEVGILLENITETQIELKNEKLMYIPINGKYKKLVKEFHRLMFNYMFSDATSFNKDLETWKVA